jgi:DNA-binding MarR family transcriptional regulator
MPRPQHISDEALLEALTDAREVTAGELASRLGIGQSTAAKRLAALEATGATRRQRGGRVDGVLAPDRWSTTTYPQRSPRGTSAKRSSSMATDSPNVEPPPTPRDGRLRRGALGALVRDYLAARPGEDLGPTQIGKALGRSQGAVANALARLEGQGAIREVSTMPRRYRVVDTPTK